MNISEEKTITPGTQLSRIYKTDPFGFPLYPYDEDQHRQSRQERGINPDAASETVSDTADREQRDAYESRLNM